MTSMAIVHSQLQELLVDEEKASEIRSLLRSQGMEHLLGDPKHSSIDCMRLLFQYGPDGHVSNLRSSSLILSKSEATCRYYTMPGGCVRGEKCSFSHPVAEFMPLEMGQSFIPKQVGGTKSEIDDSSISMTLQIQRVGAEDLGKKIFVGGLSPSVESDDLREFFEVNYGPVLDAVVIGSQAGDQMQSRGFGFVTFKHAASVSAAVEAHYINIYGKKVEIKGAVPRFELPILEVSRVDSDTHSGIAMTGNKILDLNEAEVLEVATPGSLCLPKSELPPCNQTSSLAEPQQTSSSESTPSCLSGFPSAGVCNVSGNSNLQCLIREVPPESVSPSFVCPSANVSSVSRDHSVSQSVMRGASSNTLLGRKPTWLNTFKEWLPEFLTRVSTRLKDGEWYPLSSLKGDYRAICGLELDHASLGFEKLSDFVRSFPELCRMKIVPVGRGPATHMVLLPPMNRNIPSAAGRRNLSNITTRSLVDGTRSYAEVACHGSAARLGRSDAAPPSNAAFCTSGSNLGHQEKHVGAPAPSGGMTSSTEHQPAFSYGLHQGLSLKGHGPSTAVAGDNADLKATCDGPPKTSLTYSDGHSRSGLNSGTPMTSNSSSSSRCRSANQDTLVRTDDTENLSIGETSYSDMNSGLAKEDVALLLELISRLKMTGKEHAPPAYHAATGSWPAPVTIHEAPPGQYLQKSTKNVDNEREGSIYSPFIEKEPKTPTRENNPPTTPFNHPFAGFLSENFPLQACGDKTQRGSRWVAMAFRAAELGLTTPHVSFTRILLTVTNRISARPVDTSLLHQARLKALIQSWLEYVRCALRDKLYGLRFHAGTKTCAPFAKASCVKEIKTMPNASSVTDLWSVGLPFTNLEKMILTICYPIESHQGEGTPIRRLLSQHFGVVTRECRKQGFDFFRVAYMRYFDVIVSAHSCTNIGTAEKVCWTLAQCGVALSKS